MPCCFAETPTERVPVLAYCFGFVLRLDLRCTFIGVVSQQFLAPTTMDLDVEEPDQSLGELKGFRKRWHRPQPSSPDESGPQAVSDVAGYSCDESQNLFGTDETCADDFDVAGWDLVGTPLGPQFEDSPTVLDSSVYAVPEDDQQSPDIKVLDPCKREPGWKATAFSAGTKRAKLALGKLPWELEGSAFRTSDPWQGTMLSAFDKFFSPTSIGSLDVLQSQVVRSRPQSSLNLKALPVVPIALKRARREPLDEDVRIQALAKFRDLILQDPHATQLGTSLMGRVDQGTSHDVIDQSFRDTFRMKASSTLQKRASSLVKLAKFLRAEGQLHPLRLSESQLYSALCKMREAGCGATSAQHIIEALHFLDATAKMKIISLSDVVSARCRGVARDMYLTKSPLSQKLPLTVEQVRKLETIVQNSGTVIRCIVGQILFCIHACCRWRDAQRLKAVSIETGRGESLVYADALSSKTALTAEAKTRFLPYTAIGTGIESQDWSAAWVAAREAEGLEFGDIVLPSYSEKSSCWLSTPMSSSEATFWLREFLDGTRGFVPEMVGSHSCKTTLLTWASRCARVPFSPADRRLLGHHLDPNMKSVLCYSRENYANLYAKVLNMFRLIRANEFEPDKSAIDRVVQLANEAGATVVEQAGTTDDPGVGSDSDSSVASLESLQLDAHESEGVDDRCASSFPSFPGVPESSLFVHKISGLVHVSNEDDYLICGRPTSAHFRAYAKVSERDHLVSCSQCLKSFQNRKL